MVDNNAIQRHLQTAIYFVIGSMYLSRVKNILEVTNDERSVEIKKLNRFYYSLGVLYLTLGISRLLSMGKSNGPLI